MYFLIECKFYRGNLIDFYYNKRKKSKMEKINSNHFKPKRQEKTYSNQEKNELIELAIKLNNLSQAAKQLYISRNTAKV